MVLLQSSSIRRPATAAFTGSTDGVATSTTVAAAGVEGDALDARTHSSPYSSGGVAKQQQRTPPQQYQVEAPVVLQRSTAVGAAGVEGDELACISTSSHAAAAAAARCHDLLAAAEEHWRLGAARTTPFAH